MHLKNSAAFMLLKESYAHTEDSGFIHTPHGISHSQKRKVMTEWTILGMFLKSLVSRAQHIGQKSKVMNSKSILSSIKDDKEKRKLAKREDDKEARLQREKGDGDAVSRRDLRPRSSPEESKKGDSADAKSWRVRSSKSRICRNFDVVCNNCWQTQVGIESCTSNFRFKRRQLETSSLSRTQNQRPMRKGQRSG